MASTLSLVRGLQVGLYQPQIPQNSGNIGRLCVGFNLPLHFIKPLGFSLESAQRKRAGLDYWHNLRYFVHENFTSFHEDIFSKNIDSAACNISPRIVCLSTKKSQAIEEFTFSSSDILLFGSETAGFPLQLSQEHNIQRVRLPMGEGIRSYNLANSVAMALAWASSSLRGASRSS